MKRTIDEIESCRPDLGLPARAEQTLTAFHRAQELLQPILELQQLSVQRSTALRVRCSNSLFVFTKSQWFPVYWAGVRFNFSSWKADFSRLGIFQIPCFSHNIKMLNFYNLNICKVRWSIYIFKGAESNFCSCWAGKFSSHLSTTGVCSLIVIAT